MGNAWAAGTGGEVDIAKRGAGFDSDEGSRSDDLLEDNTTQEEEIDIVEGNWGPNLVEDILLQVFSFLPAGDLAVASQGTFVQGMRSLTYAVSLQELGNSG